MWSEKYKSKINKHIKTKGFSIESIVDFWKSKDYSNIIEVSKNLFNVSKSQMLDVFNCDELTFKNKYGIMLVADMNRANRNNKQILKDYRRLMMFDGILTESRHGGGSWDFDNGNKRKIKSYSDHHHFIINLESVLNRNIAKITNKIGDDLYYSATKFSYLRNDGL